MIKEHKNRNAVADVCNVTAHHLRLRGCFFCWFSY
nr:unnamed protein product [Callosobruchus chinensis]